MTHEKFEAEPPPRDAGAAPEANSSAMDSPAGATDSAAPSSTSERVRTASAVILAVILIGWALRELVAILTPFLVAIFLFFLLRPVPKLLARTRFPPLIAYLLLLVFLAGAMVVFYGLVQANAEAFARRWSSYSERLVAWADVVGRWTGRSDDNGHFDLKELTTLPWNDIIKMVIGSSLGFIEWATLVLFYLFFLFVEAQKLPGRVRRAYQPAVADKALQVAHNIIDGINSYLRVKTLVSFGLGAGAGLLGFLFGLDFWFLWAVVTFLANYITYVGSLVAWIPPIAIAFLQFQSPTAATVFSILLIANRVFWIDYVEIRMSGQSLNVSPLLLLLALAGFGWMWGVVGMVLAVPLVTAAKIVLANFESTRHFAALASED